MDSNVTDKINFSNGLPNHVLKTYSNDSVIVTDMLDDLCHHDKQKQLTGGRKSTHL